MKSRRVDSRKFLSNGEPSTFERYAMNLTYFAQIRNAFANVPEWVWLHFHRYAASLRRFARIRDAFAKVLDDIHTDSRRIRDGFTHSPSQFAHIRKGLRRILHHSPCEICVTTPSRHPSAAGQGWG
jgi:hypothetical protein